MEQLPFYIPATFIATTLLTLFFLYKASRYSTVLLVSVLAWLLLQGVLTWSGFYRDATGIPPRFLLLLAPPVLCIAVLFITRGGRKFLNRFDPKMLTLLHLVRLPVELTLYGLFVYHDVPVIMTFEGGNFDILSGLSAPLIYYFAYRKKTLSRGWLLFWNIACLLLLLNIVGRAILSAPFAFQQFGFEQPDVALFGFPFSWLPGFVVPAVLLAHLINLRKLILNP
jgi:hypothetical protein